jgi:putative flippase GtrA
MTARLLPFSVVGGLGFVVQLGAATALTIYGWSEGVSTAFAVECAVLHNFAWHERWTWRDRRGEGSWIARLVAFHAANGVTSIAANVALVGLLARWTTLGLTVRTVMAVCLTGLLNYAAADRLVFGAPLLARRMRAHSQRLAPGAAVVMTAACIASPASAEPSIGTIAAWNRIAGGADARIAASRGRTPPFDRVLVMHGGIDLGRLDDVSEVDGATVQHWRGAVLIPGACLEQVLERLTTSLPNQPDVAAARILWQSGDHMRVYLRLVRRAIVTVTFDTEHEVEFWRVSPRLAMSRSVMTRVREVANAGASNERLLEPADDRGFLWRLNAYWWYEETPSGVIAVMETLTLGRSIPVPLRPVAAPVVKRVAAESVVSALQGIRSRFTRNSSGTRPHPCG